MAILGVDVGGTFTDAVVLDSGRISTAKVLTAERQEESVVSAARAAGAADVERFAHGTTVATNALLERKGARTCVRQRTRASSTCCTAPTDACAPLPAVRRVAGAARAARTLLAARLAAGLDAEAVAVCLLHAYRDARGTRRCGGAPAAPAARARRRVPRVAPEFREYERASTTAADAYLGPVPRATSARSPARVRTRAAGTVGHALLGRRVDAGGGGGTSRDDPRVGPGGRRRRRGRIAALAGSTTRSRSTWAGRRRTSA